MWESLHLKKSELTTQQTYSKFGSNNNILTAPKADLANSISPCHPISSCFVNMWWKQRWIGWLNKTVYKHSIEKFSAKVVALRTIIFYIVTYQYFVMSRICHPPPRRCAYAETKKLYKMASGTQASVISCPRYNFFLIQNFLQNAVLYVRGIKSKFVNLFYSQSIPVVKGFQSKYPAMFSH